MGAELSRQSLGNNADGEIINQLLQRQRLQNALSLLRDNNKLSNGIQLIYYASKCRILRVADKISSGEVMDDPVLVDLKIVPIPEKEIWDFKLGDKVRIKYCKEDFKSIQKRTLGWRTDLNKVHDHEGIVIGFVSEYSNQLNVLFPDIFTGVSLYAGLFEKVEDDGISSRWKPGDMVKTNTDLKVIKVLQQGWGEIPIQFIGEKGRVASVTERYVNVTFDEENTVTIHPALLRRCSDDSPIKKSTPTHPRGFKIGEKAKVISNLKKLVENQTGFGNWASSMNELKGQTVTIVDILKDSSVLVQMKNSRPWRVSSDSVLKLGETEEIGEKDLDFLSGDVVKVKLGSGSNIHVAFMEKDIPISFIEHLRLPARVVSVDDDLDFELQYDNEQEVAVNPSILMKVSPDEAETYKDIRERVESLKPGDSVYLDVGPAKYVRSILATEEFDQKVVSALTEASTLVGFTDSKTAVIQYENGSRYKINKKYLTVPERYGIAI